MTEPQIFQFILLCILFCWTTLRFMEWLISVHAGTNLLGASPSRWFFLSPWFGWLLVQFFRFVDVDIWWVSGPCKEAWEQPSRAHLGSFGGSLGLSQCVCRCENLVLPHSLAGPLDSSVKGVTGHDFLLVSVTFAQCKIKREMLEDRGILANGISIFKISVWTGEITSWNKLTREKREILKTV